MFFHMVGLLFHEGCGFASWTANIWELWSGCIVNDWSASLASHWPLWGADLCK